MKLEHNEPFILVWHSDEDYTSVERFSRAEAMDLRVDLLAKRKGFEVELAGHLEIEYEYKPVERVLTYERHYKD